MQVSGVNRNRSIERAVAKLYLYFMPFQMFAPFKFLNSLFVGLARRASFLFLLIGMILIVVKRREVTYGSDASSRLHSHFIRMYIIGDVTSLFMAIILFSEVGTIGGENTFDAVIPKIIFSFAYMVFIYYNREVFGLLTKEEIGNIFDRIITICIILGFLQVGVLLIGGPFTMIYNAINMLFGAWSSTAIVITGRIALLTVEPATIAGFFGMLVIPYIFSKWISEDFIMRDFIKLLLVIIILYYTKSTTGYTLLIVDFLFFGYVYISQGKANSNTKLIIILLMIISGGGVGYFITKSTIISENVTSVFDKLINEDNVNSMSRKVGLYVNWGILKRFPFFGVGNGNQGFFYREFFPQFAFSSVWATERYNEAAHTLMDGGVFFAAFASGYGLVGIVMMIGFALKSIFIMRNNKEIYGFLYYFYLIAGASLLITGFSSTLVGDYTSWFIFSLPMAVYYWNGENNENMIKRINW